MNKIKNIIFIISTFMIILFFLSGCNNNNKIEDKKEKIIEELDYLDTKIFEIANDLNNIILENYVLKTQEIRIQNNSTESSGSNKQSEESSGGGSQEGEQKQSSSQNESENTVTISEMEKNSILDSNSQDIDWKKIKSEIEIINQSWSTIILDLTSVNVNNDDILNFSDILNDLIISIKDEKKQEALIDVSKIYAFIPRFEKGINAENSLQNLKQVKSNILNSYVLVEQNNWQSIENNLKEGEDAFTNIINDMEFIKNKEYKVNNVYILLKELQNSLVYKDKKLFYVKYKNLQEAINVI